MVGMVFEKLNGNKKIKWKTFCVAIKIFGHNLPVKTFPCIEHSSQAFVRVCFYIVFLSS